MEPILHKETERTIQDQKNIQNKVHSERGTSEGIGDFDTM